MDVPALGLEQREESRGQSDPISRPVLLRRRDLVGRILRRVVDQAARPLSDLSFAPAGAASRLVGRRGRFRSLGFADFFRGGGGGGAGRGMAHRFRDLFTDREPDRVHPVVEPGDGALGL